MKQIITSSIFIETIERIRPNNFSREALQMMFDYFEQYEDDIGTEIDFDPIGICCEYVEKYPADLVYEYKLLENISGLDQEEFIKFLKEFLMENCIFIGMTPRGSFVYQQF